MSEQTPNIPTDTAWGIALESTRCPHCEWQYFTPKESAVQRCPHCFQADLIPVEDPGTQLYTQPPELVLPFNVNLAAIEQHIETFSEKIPFAPKDLEARMLCTRIQRLYLPMWLVDGEVSAIWDAEVGFDYQVVSHREHYGEEEWDTEETRETRTRWEPRAGRLQRHYDNIITPALEEHTALLHALGRYSYQDAQPYTAGEIQGTPIRLPDRAPEAAWADAIPGFQQTATEECRQAAQSDRIQRFRWSPEYTNLHWTLLLLPIYSTYYLDDNQQPQRILVNGQTGKVSGARRASMQRAQRVSLIVGIVAAIFFVLGLGLSILGLAMPPLIIAGIAILVVAFGGGLVGALIPILIAARFNRRQPAENTHRTGRQ
ncbi:MAG: hypothetical protein JXA21_01315 [Anaerolineae bacterium]|nr:hypothetical protein [Anaerolineae bacterium]